MKKHLVLFIVLCAIILSSCGIAPAAPVPPTVVLVTVAPNASPTPTPFQPIPVTQAPLDPPTDIPTFTPEPPTNTPLPTFEFTATSLVPPTVPAQTSRTQYTIYALLD